MAQDKKFTEQRLTALWNDDNVPKLDTLNKKYVIISDTHLGDGGEADDFHENEKALLAALAYYAQNRYQLILLGDVEEFWQFDLDRIERRYRDTIYAAIKAFGDSRVTRVFGNHDSEWGNPPDPARNDPNGHKGAPEAIKLRDASGQVSLLLIHGHQGSTDSDRYSWFSRFAVRGLFKPIEGAAKWLGLYGHPSATKSQVTKDYEKIYYDWAKANRVIVICGHSHRAIFASQSRADELQEKIEFLQANILTRNMPPEVVKAEVKKIEKLREELDEEKNKGRDVRALETNRRALPCYFNSGCALFTDGLTAIEIAEDAIRLVKWNKKPEQEPAAIVFKEGRLSEYIKKVKGNDV